MNATKEIKKALLGGQRLTSLAMLDKFNVMRGSALIHKLRVRGLPIKTEMVITDTGKSVARYYIDPVDRMVHRAFKVID